MQEDHRFKGKGMTILFIALAFSTVGATTRTDFGEITCPLIGMFVKNGDLIPDSNGFITRQQTRAAFIANGISVATATATTNGNFHSPECPTCPTHIDPFNMNTIPTGAAAPAPHDQPHEHFRSTGIRDTHNGTPDVFRFELTERLCMGNDKRWTIDNIDCMVELWDRDPACGNVPLPGSNDVNDAARPNGCGVCDSFQTNPKCDSLLRGSITALFNELKDLHSNSLSQSEWRGIWIDLNYPPHFPRAPQRDVCSLVKEDLEGRCSSTDNKSFTLKNNQGLNYNGRSFDDENFSNGHNGPKNACLLAFYGNKGTYDHIPNDSTRAVSGGPRMKHFNHCCCDNCSTQFGQGQKCMKTYIAEPGFDFNKFMVGDACTRTTDLDASYRELHCVFDVDITIGDGGWSTTANKYCAEAGKVRAITWFKTFEDCFGSSFRYCTWNCARSGSHWGGTNNCRPISSGCGSYIRERPQVIAGKNLSLGKRLSPMWQTIHCNTPGCSVTINVSEKSSIEVEIMATDYESSNEYIEVIVDGNKLNEHCDPGRDKGHNYWHSCGGPYTVTSSIVLDATPEVNAFPDPITKGYVVARYLNEPISMLHRHVPGDSVTTIKSTTA